MFWRYLWVSGTLVLVIAAGCTLGWLAGSFWLLRPHPQVAALHPTPVPASRPGTAEAAQVPIPVPNPRTAHQV